MRKLSIPKIDGYNLLYDFRDFMRANKVKYLIYAVVCLIAIVLGIRGAFTVSNAGTFLYEHSTRTFSFVIGSKSLFGYGASLFLSCIIVLAVMALCSCNFLMSYFTFVLLFIRSYLYTLYFCLYIIFFKMSILPFAIVCMLCFIITTFIYITIAIMAYNRAWDIRRFGKCSNTCVPLFLRKLILPSAILAVICIVCVILAYFLTLGIIL